MNILIIGSGGREHAVCKKLIKSIYVINLFYIGQNNPGMDKISKHVDTGININIALQTVSTHGIDLVFIGPESALEMGIVDALNKNNIPVIGPTKSLARIETSKSWARELMIKYNLQAYCPEFITINRNDNLENIIMNNPAIVVKPDGLHSGKGVKVYGDHFNTITERDEYISEILKSGEIVLLEEKLFGEEFTIMSFTDGVNTQHMPPVKDYKRVYDDNKGPNCGSMGSIVTKLWFLTEQDIEICHRINEKIVKILHEETGEYYKGILYGSFIKTQDGTIKVIEFNARFGDPECIPVLHLMKNDLVDIFTRIIFGTLDRINLKFKDEDCVFKYAVPANYPNVIDTNKEKISIPDNILSNDNIIFANVVLNNNEFYSGKSRTIGILSYDKDITVAAENANEILQKIEGKLHFRRDVGLDLSLTYKKAGIDIDVKNDAIESIKNDINSTYNNDVLSTMGDFAGMIKLNDSVLVTSIDGVGTKSILVLEQLGPEVGFELLGEDLVNLNVNDILVKGADPLFFLDYFGCHRLNKNHLSYFIKGVTKACKQLNCCLIKGETAIMPDIYKENTYDLVGTIIGTVKEQNIINGKNSIKENDIVIGLPSNGFGTNGFTLIRKILNRASMYQELNKDMLKKICAPHKSYYDEIKTIRENINIHGLCHITGGGLIENPPRIMPDNLKINWLKWERPDIFNYVQEKGCVGDQEMMRIFNCGIGFLVVMDKNDLNKMEKLNIDYKIVGSVINS